ncbi:unnamed protein product [Euphydryas editha]|uniref:HTH psq-type domain-containing protein n=1 Tax=Euphydryas editha TaxID=104508 RepID=A0AAU9U1Z9_EUPED|nr:unnamed protein product [Euphydryas editha]
MEPSTKKRRGEWTETQLKSALQAVKSCQMSQRKAAETYGIPRRTLRNHIESGSMEKITGRVPILNKSQEKDLCKRILSQIGMPLTPKIVRKQAYEFCKSNNIPNFFNDKKNIAGKKIFETQSRNIASKGSIVKSRQSTKTQQANSFKAF